jgi:hypothetical protein
MNLIFSSPLVVVPRKYLSTSKLSFSACLAENPGSLKLTSHRPLGMTR